MAASGAHILSDDCPEQCAQRLAEWCRSNILPPCAPGLACTLCQAISSLLLLPACSGDMFKKQDIQELRQFSQNIESKLSRSLGAESKMPAQPPSAQAAAGAAGEGGQAAAAAAVHSAAAAGEAGAPAAGGAEQPAASPAVDASKKSALNPFAKSFNFNVNAKEFKPVFIPPAAAAGAAPAAAPAPTPPAAAAGAAAAPVPEAAPGAASTASAVLAGPPPSSVQPGPATGGGPAGVGAFKQGPASPLRGPMQPSIPMPDMRPDFRRMPRGDGRDMDGGGPHPPRPERDSSFGRRREESRERGGPAFERRRDGRHYEGGPGMRPGEGGPPPPPPKGPGGPQGMQASHCLPSCCLLWCLARIHASGAWGLP